ncbi:Maph40 [Matsumuraeses phaseoli granulovirus]|uniref:Maph40 n=1 Tax=Matsumuraeses phaseoli granulovirus TaxID=2760664 RepID=A0AAE7MLF0_9BBAC|nr:Maph40 [Matsumuraeses phaseoli granulovirus]QOD40003.1 Maph40 [Matsumuraeses phaseoli granulovirus]
MELAIKKDFMKSMVIKERHRMIVVDWFFCNNEMLGVKACEVAQMYFDKIVETYNKPMAVVDIQGIAAACMMLSSNVSVRYFVYICDFQYNEEQLMEYYVHVESKLKKYRSPVPFYRYIVKISNKSKCLKLFKLSHFLLRLCMFNSALTHETIYELCYCVVEFASKLQNGFRYYKSPLIKSKRLHILRARVVKWCKNFLKQYVLNLSVVDNVTEIRRVYRKLCRSDKMAIRRMITFDYIMFPNNKCVQPTRLQVDIKKRPNVSDNVTSYLLSREYIM